MEQEVVVSYDFGTSGVKAAVIDRKGRVLCTSVRPYPLQTRKTGWAEQRPEHYWRAVCEATKAVLAQNTDAVLSAAGIVCCSQWKGIILIGREGQILYPCITWLDARAGKQAEILNRKMKTREFSAQSYWAKLMWLKENETELYEQADRILEVNSFIKWKLTGNFAVDATNHFADSDDPSMRKHYQEILDAAGLDREKIPPIVPVESVVGQVTDTAAEETGLKAGTPVFAGCGDIPAIAMGIGCAEPGESHAYFGTSGWLGVVSAPGKTEHVMARSALLPGREILLNTMQTVGISLDWTIGLFYPQEWEQKEKEIYPLLERELQKVPPGSQGLFALPWLNGELPPFSEFARAGFINASAAHGRADFVHAMMEGICCNMQWRKLECEKASGEPITTLRITGGGAGGNHLMQMLADILGIPVQVPESHRHTGAVGAAFCALVGLGYYEDFRECGRQVKIKREYVPRTSRKAFYQELCGRYLELFQCLEKFFRNVNS